MEERKSEVTVSSPIFYNASANLGLAVRLYEETLGEDEYDQGYLGILASIEMLADEVPEEAFSFYCTMLFHAFSERLIYDADGSKTPIPEFDPNDPMCADCRPLVDIAIAQYAFLAAKDEPNPMKDFLGPIFSLSGIGIEGLDDGYHIKNDELKSFYDRIKQVYCPEDKALREQSKQNLKRKVDSLIEIFGGNGNE